ncbi:MAG: surface-adhesin E family protein [Thermodesulfobacteriota bacterium]|jgi:hypothetical protein
MKRSTFLKLFLVSVVLLLSIFITNNKVFSENWVFFATRTSNNVDFYYDKDDIMNLSPEIKRVWTKYSEPLKEMLEHRIKIGASISDFSSYAYTLDFLEIDCKKKQYEIINYTHYSKDGETLDSSEKENLKPESIRPGSIMEGLHKAICP